MDIKISKSKESLKSFGVNLGLKLTLLFIFFFLILYSPTTLKGKDHNIYTKGTTFSIETVSDGNLIQKSVDAEFLFWYKIANISNKEGILNNTDNLVNNIPLIKNIALHKEEV